MATARRGPRKCSAIDREEVPPGNPADLVVWNAATPAEVVATVAQPAMGFKRGRRVFTREAPTLHRP